MHAQVIRRYGDADALVPADLPRPVPDEGELLVKVHAASVNRVDWRILRGDLRWLTGRDFPKVLGSDVAGTVAEVGPGVTGFEVSDEVFAMLPTLKGGAYATYAVADASETARKPASLSFEETAAVPLAALTALQGLRDEGALRSDGRHVVVNGATGGVGHFAVQLARAFGAEVTGVCSGRHDEPARRLGCRAVLDYTEGRVLERMQRHMKTDAPFDLFFDAAGTQSYWKTAGLLALGGRYVTTTPSPLNFLFQLLTLALPKKAKVVRVAPRSRDLAYLAQLIDDGRLTPVVDRVFPLDEVREAHRHSQDGHPVGKIVLRMAA